MSNTENIIILSFVNTQEEKKKFSKKKPNKSQKPSSNNITNIYVEVIKGFCPQ